MDRPTRRANQARKSRCLGDGGWQEPAAREPPRPLLRRRATFSGREPGRRTRPALRVLYMVSRHYQFRLDG